MIFRHVADWNAAYTNWPHIPESGRWPAAWIEPAQAFRDTLTSHRKRLDLAYGGQPRNRFDLFLPEVAPQGLVVFVHGGYWMRFDRTHWSHLAAGPLAQGWAVAQPGYTLCPDIRITGIVAEVAQAVEAAAALIDGPIRLVGHSAGGHLATRLACADTGLSRQTRRRIAAVLSISGVHDLRPLLGVGFNDTLKLDAEEAARESPALQVPLPGVRLTCWVGSAELAEFVRQSALLANVWTGLGAATALVVEPDRHHFNVVDGLADPEHALTRALLAD